MAARDKERYYWLKLKRDFFKRHDIRVIEDMPNGKEYVLFYLKLMVEEQPLPPGTYYIEYIVTDVFKRSFPLDRFEVHWDGENMTCPNLDAWTGEVTLN